MTRHEMIDILIEDRLTEWVYAQNTDSLEEILYLGWKGYEKYTDDELKKAIDDFDEEMIKRYQLSISERLIDDYVNKGENKEVENSIPFL